LTLGATGPVIVCLCSLRISSGSLRISDRRRNAGVWLIKVFVFIIKFIETVRLANHVIADGIDGFELLAAVYAATADPIWIKQLRRITKSEAVVDHVLEGEFDRVECFIAEKAFGKMDRMAVLRR
jgi:hypothetical protein